MRFSVFNSDAERREGLKTLLRQIDRQARFNDIHDWHQAARMLRRQHSDILVIDWQEWMTISDLQHLLKGFPHLAVAVLTDDVSPANICLLLNSGVRGVIPRKSDPHLITLALEMVIRGWRYIPEEAIKLNVPRISNHAVHRSNPAGHLPYQPRLIAKLSPRQQQILRCVHMGSTNKMIARTLGIAEGTVKVHLSSIFQQLGAANRTAAVANYNGWLTQSLEVLRSSEEASPRPIHGKAGLVPLRHPVKPPLSYPLPSEPVDPPMAAEPTSPFGDTENPDPETETETEH
ncbi:response regulator transcription factor [Paraburkholderia bonniea]|uniref:helix-turn-helix transcriptional regulator n=1 Tax=Paraburkholderia bonniea TaxID=2152891 RepID=UPI0012911E71|nr:response regulator transcription factor [Paraburkholderia bonniea]WJF91564.1 response regulator transcription factor [Paraburkholderia bonniea]WJF94884.1 response regulator transcription factor [Paraburkholderia bonniea]